MIKKVNFGNHVFIDYTQYIQPSPVKAYFTTRIGPRDNKDSSLPSTLLKKKPRLIYCSQVHGINIYKDDGTSTGCVGEYDAIISHFDDVIIQTFHADCLPIYVVDTKTHWFGAAHSGWRGTYQQMPKVLVDQLLSASKGNLKDLKIVIGPGIAVENYEVDKQLYDKFLARFGDEAVVEINQRYAVNLSKCIELTLLKIGVQPKQIYKEICDTYADDDLFYSYRRQGADAGRMATVMYLDYERK